MFFDPPSWRALEAHQAASLACLRAALVAPLVVQEESLQRVVESNADLNGFLVDAKDESTTP